MKNLLVVGLVCLLVSCAKTNEKPNETVQVVGKKETCDFGLESFNLAKRETIPAEQSRKPQSPGGGNGGGNGGSTGGSTGGGTTPTPTPTGSAVILLDFDGHVVSQTSWNYAGDIYCSPANMYTDEMARVIERVSNDYSPFNVTVTTSESVFNAAPVNKRTRVVITETYEWFGQAGGTSFVGSFYNGSGAPCFVFSSMLNYSAKNIGEAASHEAGHTLGLSHQAQYSGCTKISDYHSGIGYGETGWAPIMGSSYSQNLSLWHRGPTASSCSSSQDDVAMIASIIGYRVDDHSNGISGATPFSTTASGLINTSSDVDYFSLNISSARTIALVPANVGAGNSGANTDLVLSIYNSYGSLVTTINDASVLNASAYVGAGTYYVAVSTAANANAGVYGMLGKYNLSVY